ncbi:hypothetical protein RI129_006103 [Pyrocoelia pectoralis]|uniref:Amine oxidase domain-containing protein n=1 Tax=Pyrocoelia pectoralis TaxID=417401 RepID=A0AAN7VDI4_9COLE
MCSSLYFIFSLLLFSRVDCLKDPNIIIIGAGASGIAAATRLYQNGFKNITILEAENRIGGRIYAFQFGEAYIDLGSQRCRGQENNVVYEYNEEIRARWKNDVNKLAVAEDCLDVFRKWVETQEGSFSWFNIAATNSYEVCGGKLALGWNGLGYKTILDVMMQKFLDSKSPIPIDDKIILNKVVEKVLWASPDRTEIKCANGASYSCDHVIWTPSLGVLKHSYKTLFQPQLPIEKITAIKAIGMGAILKIFLHFPKRWWNDDFERIIYVWNSSDLQRSGGAFLEGPQKEGKSWITAMSSILPVPKSPNLLSAWFGGEFVPDIEKSSDETIMNGIMYTLQTFLSVDYPNISLPNKIIRKNWYTDPHFRGTYSYETVESRKLDKPQGEIISEPLLSEEGKPVLLFAGEVTNPIHYSTVHGAIESGFREVDRLINFYKHSK